MNGDQVHSKDASACLTQKTDVEHKRWRTNCRNTERKDRLETYEMTQILMFGAEEVKLHKTDYSISAYIALFKSRTQCTIVSLQIFCMLPQYVVADQQRVKV